MAKIGEMVFTLKANTEPFIAAVEAAIASSSSMILFRDPISEVDAMDIDDNAKQIVLDMILERQYEALKPENN